MSQAMRKLVLIQELYLKQTVLPAICNRILFKDSLEEFFQLPGNTDLLPAKNQIFSIMHIPGYLKMDYREDQGITIKKFPYLKGFTILLDGYTDIDNYMAGHFSKKSKANILRGYKRMKHSFDIRFQRYHGEIEAQRCTELLEQLKQMIIARFEQRGEESATLAHWDQICDNLYDLIISKKASLSVISHGNTPISISVSYHYPKLFFYFITSYDLDYSKFSMGHIMLYEQLNWCFANDIRYFEMGWGELDYKKRWSNFEHNFEHHIVFNRQALKGKLYALVFGNKSRLIVFLQGKKYYEVYQLLKKKLRNREMGTHETLNYTFEDIPPEALPEEIISVSDSEIGQYHLKLAINDFIYYTGEQYSDVGIYREATKGDYFIKGRKAAKRIVIRNNLSM